MISVTLAAVLAFAAAASAQAPAVPNWQYTDPAGWADEPNSAICVSGKRQSPIALGLAATAPSLKNTFKNVDTASQSGKLTNTGRYLKWNPDSIDASAGLVLQMSEIKDITYALESINFHWGNISACQAGKPCNGSEHIINGKSAPAEVQLYFINSNFASMDEAKAQPLGVAAVAFQMVLVQGQKPARDWSPLFQAVPSVKAALANTAVTLTWANLIPAFATSNSGRFYRYPGSLTTPTCDEGVQWTVYQDPIQVLSLSSLNQLQTTDNSPNAKNKTPQLLNTIRQLQSVGDRTIRSNQNP